MIANNLCGSCGGKGFHWQTGQIINRVDGSTIATTYAKGPVCETCKGTGQRDLSLAIMAAAALAALLIVAAILLIGPFFK